MGNFHQCFCCRILSVFLKLPNSFPSHFHASVFTVHFPDSSYTVLLKSKTQNTFWNKYVTSHWPNQVFKAMAIFLGFPPLLGSALAAGLFRCRLSQHNRLPVSSVHVVPLLAGIIIVIDQLLTLLASVTSQFSQEVSCKTTSLQQIHSIKQVWKCMLVI